MRLAFLSSTPPSALEGSGTFVAVDGLRRGLEALGHAVTLHPLRARTRFHTLDRWLYNLRLMVQPPEADVVVGVDLDGFLWARRRHRPPLVAALKGVIADELLNERGWVRILLGLQARWERDNCARAERIVVPSHYSAGVAGRAYGIPADKLAVVPEPVDLAGWRRFFDAVPVPARRRPTVLAVARMYPRKRLQDLLRAAVVLRQRIPEIEVRIVGDGPEAARLRHLHAVLALGDSVVFLGAISRLALAVEYKRAHCFCLPSVQEGFGLVFAEAMAAALPVVACRAAAVPEVVGDRRTGLLVNPCSPDELAMALETLLRNEGLARDLGAEGARRVEAFDLVPVAARFVEALPS